MLNIQTWLKQNNFDFTKLEADFGIKTNFHPEDDRVILNYSQYDSPRFNPIADEARALCLNRNTGEVIAKSFNRFYNYGEGECNFDWSKFTTYEKVDGSLILIYKYNGEIQVNTRNSFADGEISPETKLSWKDIVLRLLQFEPKEGITYVCELCSVYNKVVKYHPTPKLYLLSAFNNTTLQEYDNWACSYIQDMPKEYNATNLEEVHALLEKIDDAGELDEGFVLRDCRGQRLKLKAKSYLKHHRLLDNRNLFMVKNLVPIVLDNEIPEIIAVFPEVKDKIESIANQIHQWKKELDNLWFCHHDENNRKKYAQAVLPHELSAIMFQAKDRGVNPVDLFKENEELIIKKMKEV